MSDLAIDKLVPNFEIAATGDQTISLADQKGKNVVIYFYPKDSTPGCTREGQDFRNLYDQFIVKNTVVFGVSRDGIKSHENFKTKQGFPFELLSDKEELLCEIFDVIKEKNMYGKKFMGIVRSTFLIDAEGVLRKEWRKVKVPDHAQEVLDAVDNL